MPATMALNQESCQLFNAPISNINRNRTMTCDNCFTKEVITMVMSDEEECELITAGIAKFIDKTEEMYERYGLPIPKGLMKLKRRNQRAMIKESKEER